MKEEKVKQINSFVNDARRYLKEKYHLDLADLYLQFSRYNALTSNNTPHAFINFLYKKGFSKEMGLYLRNIAKEFYKIELEYFLMVSYLSGVKSLPSFYRMNRYIRRRVIKEPFRTKKKYNKNKSKAKKKSEEEKNKELYYRLKYRHRSKANYSRYSYWEPKGFVNKKSRRQSRQELMKYK